jgi:uncharacterized SAM-binding protein YcdF (DUF218 family)
VLPDEIMPSHEQSAKPAVERRGIGFWAGGAIALLTFVILEMVVRGATDLAHPASLLVFVLGGLLGRSRAGWFLPAAGLLAGLGVVLCIATPLLPTLMQRFIREDSLAPADAVVVLSSSVTGDGTLDAYATERLLGALPILKDGYAGALVRTNLAEGYPSPEDDVAGLLELTAVDVPQFTVGPVSSTRDEAEEIARLAEEQGWHSLILVTSPSHSARAAATLEAAGLSVISRPCPERVFSMSGRIEPKDKFQMIFTVTHESLAWLLYRQRGWVR